MSTATSRFRNLTAVHADRWGLLLAALFLTVLAGSVYVATWLSGAGVEPAMGGTSGGEQAAAGAGWAIAEAIFAALLLGVILLYKRLPEWAQDVVKTAVVVVPAMWLGVLAVQNGAFWPVALGVVGYYAIVKATDAYDVYWLWQNFEAVALAIVLGGAVGAVLPLPFLAVGIVGLTIYDHVFANENDWMFTLGGGMLRAKLPVVVFAFPRLRVAWDDICDSLAADRDEETDDGVFEGTSQFGIGTADLLLPAAFASAVAVTGGGVTLPVLGVAAGVGVAALRLRWEMLNVGSGAGMPAIAGGVLGGYAVALVPAVLLL